MAHTNDFLKLNDRQLITIIKNPEVSKQDYNNAFEVLFNRYEKQIHKIWWSLNRQFGGQGIVETVKDEYYSAAYEAFFKAVSEIKLEKIRDDNWKLVQYSSFYLRNVKNKLAKQIVKNANVRSTQNLVSMGFEEENSENRMDNETEEAYYNQEGFVYNPEYSYLYKHDEDICNKVLDECFNRWHPLKREIYRMLLKKIPKKEMAESLGITTLKLYNNISAMKRDLRKHMNKALENDGKAKWMDKAQVRAPLLSIDIDSLSSDDDAAMIVPSLTILQFWVKSTVSLLLSCSSIMLVLILSILSLRFHR